MLSSKNLPLGSTKKFHSQFVGPFTVVALVGPVAARLALTKKIRGLHLVFHISLLHKYKPGGDGIIPLPPIVLDKEEEYGVEALLAHRV